MFKCINLYVAIHDITVFIIKVAVLMHEHVHFCLHLSIVNKTLVDIRFIILCLTVLYILYLCPDNEHPPQAPFLHSRNMPASTFLMSTIVHLL